MRHYTLKLDRHNIDTKWLSERATAGARPTPHNDVWNCGHSQFGPKCQHMLPALTWASGCYYQVAGACTENLVPWCDSIMSAVAAMGVAFRFLYFTHFIPHEMEAMASAVPGGKSARVAAAEEEANHDVRRIR